VSLADLPAVNAAFNGLAGVFLACGFYFIRNGRIQAHRACMISAICSSTLFLAGYLTYHFTVHTFTRFHDPAWFRPYYLVLLLTHTILAATVPPLVITTVIFAARGRFETHKKIARWTWPIWMYVSVTGVIIYFLLYQIYPQR
jgi:putative membrane protein